jgi:hypothetical protein
MDLLLLLHRPLSKKLLRNQSFSSHENFKMELNTIKRIAPTLFEMQPMMSNAKTAPNWQETTWPPGPSPGKAQKGGKLTFETR